MRRDNRTVEVYRYKKLWSMPEFLPDWGTLEAIAMLDGCVPLRPTQRRVSFAHVDRDGFLPLGVTPDDLAP